jgi:hypothetical protein
MHSILIALLAVSITAHARPIEVLTYQQLYDKADLVLILKVQAITETDAKTRQYGDPDYYQGYKAKCQVLSVLKGKLDQPVVAVPFFQHPKGIPGFNGAIPAPFSLRDNLVYLAYLKRGQHGELGALTGEYEAGRSIKMMFDWGSDIVPLKLPPHGTKPAEPGGPSNGSQPIRSETNSTSGAAGSRR